MGKPILLIDDDELVLQTLGLLLESRGFKVEKARNGFEAIEKAHLGEFGLVISDIRMPGMDGIELIQKMRQINKDRKRSPVPEILITGYADENAYLKALRLNITDYLYKPFDMDTLLDLIRKRISS